MRTRLETVRCECPSMDVDYWVDDGGLGRVRAVHPRMMSRSGLGGPAERGARGRVAMTQPDTLIFWICVGL